jgi:hypothetical protein
MINFVTVAGLVTDHIADSKGPRFEPQLYSLRLKSEDKTARACVCVCVGGGGGGGLLMGFFQYRSDK